VNAYAIEAFLGGRENEGVGRKKKSKTSCNKLVPTHKIFQHALRPSFSHIAPFIPHSTFVFSSV
jgi:hypothetical protein